MPPLEQGSTWSDCGAAGPTVVISTEDPEAPRCPSGAASGKAPVAVVIAGAGMGSALGARAGAIGAGRSRPGRSAGEGSSLVPAVQPRTRKTTASPAIRIALV